MKPKRFPAALGNARAMHNKVAVPLKAVHRSIFQHSTEKWRHVASLSLVRYSSTLNVPPGGSNKPILIADKQPFSTLLHKLKPAHEDDEFPSSGTNDRSSVSTPAFVRVPSSVANIQPTKSVSDAKIKLNLHGPRDVAWYTGKVPRHGHCAGVEADGRIYSLPHLTFQPNLEGTTKTAEAARIRHSLQAYFDNTWSMTEVLLGSLQGEEAFMRPPYHDLRHPMIFYYGHPAALYVNKLRVAGLLDKPINAYYEVIFETGVDEMSWDDLSKNQMAWPSVADVHAYRSQVYKTVSALITNLSDAQCLSVNQQSPLWALVMAFEHERIHLETSSFLISELPLEYVRFPEGMPSYHPTAPLAKTNDPVKVPVAGVHYPENEMVSVPETVVTIGKPREFPSFGWDNEYGQRTFTVPAFKASQFKITNGEFLQFMQDGGYARSELWTPTGWEWRAFRNVKMPTHFIRTGPQGQHEYVLRLLFDQTTAMPWDWPVVVNLHEATAFAKWKSLKTGKPYRVMTELEHRAIRDNGMEGVVDTVQGDYAAVVGGNKMMQQVRHATILLIP